MQYQIPKGVFDILPQDPDPKGGWRQVDRWQHVEAVIRATAGHYGYQEIRTPVFERTELFQRSVGEGSDIVSKEMYTFEDRGERSMTLRPEGTAPVMRAFLEKKLYALAPIHKFYYIEPMFRYERQQAGRYRQHHQFGVEAIGHSAPEQDVEVIDLLYTLLGRLGLKGLSLLINSLGDAACRHVYRQRLWNYLTPLRNQLSSDSQARFDGNPLRILDSKAPEDQEIIAEAPLLTEILDEASRDHFAAVCKGLTQLRIPFTLAPRLVRGLDYYNRTVFEMTAGELGAQNSVGGGGRYDGLLQTLGGPDLPACGFGSGIERILQTMLGQGLAFPGPMRPALYLIPLGDAAKASCFALLTSLRRSGISAEMELGGKKLKAAMSMADKAQALYTSVVGDEELKKGIFTLKEMASGKTQELSAEQFLEQFRTIIHGLYSSSR